MHQERDNTVKASLQLCPFVSRQGPASMTCLVVEQHAKRYLRHVVLARTPGVPLDAGPVQISHPSAETHFGALLPPLLAPGSAAM